ncbi:unnamed protein product, partial [Rotaria magnacalcarata]
IFTYDDSITTVTTTIDTQKPLKSTSSFPHRQAIDECGGICYPDSMPNGTNLTGCTITFTGLKGGVWYAVAIQVEDFINTTSMVPMSSVPVQMLIYVQPEPTCSYNPTIFPLQQCLEVQANVSITFNISAKNQCIPSIDTLADILVSMNITGMSRSNLTSVSANSSVSYVVFNWTPQMDQIGYQQLCVIAIT